MKLLYFSCHETLEHDELSMFSKLGFEVFPIGHYTKFDQPIKSSREKLDIPVMQEAVDIFNRYHSYEKLKTKLSDIKSGSKGPYMFKVHPELARIFDVVVVSYYEENITLNWDTIKDKHVVLRTISQLQSHRSPFRSKVKTVALSPQEKFLHGYTPDKVIRQSVDTNLYSGWQGNSDVVLTVNKWLKKRGDVSAWDAYNQVTKDFNRLVCGFGNEDISWAISDLPQSKIQEIRQNAGVYFSTCSKPGGVTYTFVEALSTGIPMVTIGPNLGNFAPNVPSFDAHLFIKNGYNGFWSDDVRELKKYIRELINNKELAKQISINGRNTAIEHFSIEKCTQDWKDFFHEKLHIM